MRLATFVLNYWGCVGTGRGVNWQNVKQVWKSAIRGVPIWSGGGVLTGEFTDQNSTLASQCITYSTVKYLLVDV